MIAMGAPSNAGALARRVRRVNFILLSPDEVGVDWAGPVHGASAPGGTLGASHAFGKFKFFDLRIDQVYS
jgi:hypothetical protein